MGGLGGTLKGRGFLEFLDFRGFLGIPWILRNYALALPILGVTGFEQFLYGLRPRKRHRYLFNEVGWRPGVDKARDEAHTAAAYSSSKSNMSFHGCQSPLAS